MVDGGRASPGIAAIEPVGRRTPAGGAQDNKNSPAEKHYFHCNPPEIGGVPVETAW
jgi:hypothetical protein